MQKHFADLKRLASIKRENAKHNSPELLSLGCWRWMIQRVEETAQSRGLGDYYWTEGQDNILYAFLVITPREALPSRFHWEPLIPNTFLSSPRKGTGATMYGSCWQVQNHEVTLMWQLDLGLTFHLVFSESVKQPGVGLAQHSLGMRCGHLSLCKIKSGPITDQIMYFRETGWSPHHPLTCECNITEKEHLGIWNQFEINSIWFVSF